MFTFSLIWYRGLQIYYISFTVFLVTQVSLVVMARYVVRNQSNCFVLALMLILEALCTDFTSRRHNKDCIACII